MNETRSHTHTINHSIRKSHSVYGLGRRGRVNCLPEIIDDNQVENVPENADKNTRPELERVQNSDAN